MNEFQLKKFIPLDKSWIIRMGVLDIVNGYDDIKKFLDKQSSLSDDLLALKRAYKKWRANTPIDVGESGTLYRLLQFASWKLSLRKKFIVRGTLKNRRITDDPKIVNLPLGKLLKLDHGTSQWASAAVLLGNKERVANPPFKLRITYQAVKHWQNQRAKGLSWKPRYDETLLRQAKIFLALLQKRKVKFIPKQAEDYCFARVFNFISKKDGEERWPSLKNHESNRIVEMEKVVKSAKSGKEIGSKDHRVIQAMVMWSEVNNVPVRVGYPGAVKKSWPEFWNFIRSVQ